ncbi:MAG: NAD(P)/FAD-dependent oxidoreductase [Coriobacteriales bacterium]|jgi:uncharacterized FAD-dependent dehydrogenase
MKNLKTDILIIGAGPAGIFTAISLLKRHDSRDITIVEQGLPIEKRTCPKSISGRCANCKPCRITTGFSGAGAFSDGKLSLSHEVGGDLPELIGADLTQSTIEEVDKIYLEFGADEHVEGLGESNGKAEIRRRAIKAGLKLVDCPIRHLGTEKAHELYQRIEEYLKGSGINFIFQTVCTYLKIDSKKCTGAFLESPEGEKYEIDADEVIVCTGRRGAAWLDQICRDEGIEHSPGPCDIGVRVEVRDEIMTEVNNVLYESKLIGYPDPFRDKVRTFCQNPSGFVSQENYSGGLAVVNGHSYKERKSGNTNLAILCSHYFKEPFDQPIAYAQKVGELVNMLAAGGILVQRFGDIRDGKRTWPKEMSRSNVVATMPDAQPGDITSAMPYRTMTDIINFILAVDVVVPGFASDETLLYSPELKFYSNRVKMTPEFETNISGLHCLGDSSGWTRGLMMSSVMGYLMGKVLAG